ncbi:MAG: MATE family efflux transporter [Carbonactinosporaceae bacterium]
MEPSSVPEGTRRPLGLPPLRHPHDREILRLAVPAFGALVAEPLFLLTDSAIVGHLGTPQLGGLGVASTVLQTLVFLCIFLAYGTTAAVSRRLGAGDHQGAIQQGIDGIWLGAALGVLALAVGIPLTPNVVEMFGTSSDVTPYAITYLRISLLGAPSMLVVLAATGVLRGLQDTRTPLVVAVAGFGANIVLNLALVYGLGLGIAGSALGTVAAQSGMALAYLTVVGRGARRHGAALRPDLAGIRAAGASGVPLVLRTLSLRVVLIVATAVATRLGDASLAAHQVAFTIWSFLALALDAVAIAGQAIVGRCLGASDVAGARAATRRIMEWGLAAGVVLAVPVVVGRWAYVPLFTADPEVQAQMAAALVVVGVLQPVAGIVFALDGVLIGAGDARYLAAAGVGTVIAFLPAAWAVLAFGGTLFALWWSLGWWVVTRMITLGLRVRGRAWAVTGAVRA